MAKEKKYSKFIKILILLLISLFLSGIFFAQAFNLIELISPELGFLFAGISTNFLIIVLVMIVLWFGWIVILPTYFPKVLDVVYPNHSKKDKEKILDNLFQTVTKNALLLFLTVLFSGLSYNVISPIPIGNDFGYPAMNWFLFWFVSLHALLLFFGLVIELEKLVNGDKK